MMRARLKISIFIALTMQISCATSIGIHDSLPQIFVVLGTNRCNTALRATDLFATPGSDCSWQMIDATGRAIDAPIIRLNSIQSSLYGANLAIPMVSGEIEFLATGPSGEFSLVAVEAPNDQATSVFDPPLAIAPVQISPDQSFDSSTLMRVDWMDGRGERDRGVGTRTMRIVGTEQVRTPLGEFETIRLETKFDAVLRFAKANRTTTLWVAPGIGPVAEEWHERITVFGVPISTESGIALRILPIPSTKSSLVP